MFHILNLRARLGWLTELPRHGPGCRLHFALLMLREARQIGLRPDQLPEMPELTRVAEMQEELERRQPAGMRAFNVSPRVTFSPIFKLQYVLPLRRPLVA